MKITVLAKPRSRERKVVKNSDGSYTVWVSEPPDDGKANKAIIYALAKHFNIAQSRVELVSGHAGKKKIVRIV
ncbi:DUF167 domain-containing protein [Candidatus Uhrbacteria bacterium]|nr:DUF167 domain-containing protein [Candidatus Uhrbacteria bacterium]